MEISPLGNADKKSKGSLYLSKKAWTEYGLKVHNGGVFMIFKVVFISQKSLLNFAVNERKIRADIFLEEMEKSIPWDAFIELMSLEYYKKGDNRGRPKADLLSLLKAYFLQKWYSLSDLSCEEMIHDRLSFRNFIDLDICETSPDSTTIGKFRNFLEEHNFTHQMFTKSVAILEEKGLIIKDGTSVDATIVHAPSSTKNKECMK